MKHEYQPITLDIHRYAEWVRIRRLLPIHVKEIVIQPLGISEGYPKPGYSTVVGYMHSLIRGDLDEREILPDCYKPLYFKGMGLVEEFFEYVPKYELNDFFSEVNPEEYLIFLQSFKDTCTIRRINHIYY